MNERMATLKSVAKAIITTCDITSEVIEDAGKGVLNLTSGLRHLTGAFDSICDGIEQEQRLRTRVKIREIEAEYAELLA